MNIAIYTDTLSIKGGGSKAVIELANQLNADIITAGYNPQINDWIKIKTKVIDLGNLTLKYNHSLGYLVESPLRFLVNKREFDYDVHIFTGVASFFASRKGNKNIWLCLSPNRIIYDLHSWKLKNSSPLKRLFFFTYSMILKPLDQRYIKNNISVIVSQTKLIFNRVKKYYDLDSEIIHTAVDTSKYKFNRVGDFFLTVSRLMSEKRIPLIVEAFKKMPSEKLVIVGSGPEKDSIVRSIKNAENISLLENLDEEELLSLYSDCLATLYMPMDEDFGFVPIEGMASGKPSIAVDEGGCRETVINNRTGFLIKANANSIVDAVKKMSISSVKKMKDDCIRQARKFDTQVITAQWKQLISGI